MEVGGVGPGLTRHNVIGKSSQIALYQFYSFGVDLVYHVYCTLLKVVSYYDECSVHVSDGF